MHVVARAVSISLAHIRRQGLPEGAEAGLSYLVGEVELANRHLVLVIFVEVVTKIPLLAQPTQPVLAHHGAALAGQRLHIQAHRSQWPLRLGHLSLHIEQELSSQVLRCRPRGHPLSRPRVGMRSHLRSGTRYRTPHRPTAHQNETPLLPACIQHSDVISHQPDVAQHAALSTSTMHACTQHTLPCHFRAREPSVTFFLSHFFSSLSSFGRRSQTAGRK
jgi:hypothetical protein